MYQLYTYYDILSNYAVFRFDKRKNYVVNIFLQKNNPSDCGIVFEISKLTDPFDLYINFFQ
jgi:hypothetical protein